MPESPLLHAHAIQKHFGATHALDGAELSIGRGEIHALVGENGAGKSTMIKILAGALRPDGGRILWRGQPYQPARPADARRRGIATCHQELAIAPHLTVTENVLLGQELARAGWIRRRPSAERVRALLALLEQSHIPLHLPAGRLPLAQQQFVEIARALAADAQLIVLDEPTSALTQADARHLFDRIRALRDQGVSFLYVSHFLEEVMELCDRYTVMRDGRTVDSGRVAEIGPDDLVAKMVGRRVDQLFPRPARTPGAEVLAVANLSGPGGRPAGVSLSLRAGEVVGIGGLVGSGRSELLRTIYGLLPPASGEAVLIAGDRPRPLTAGADRRIRLGLGFASEDRKNEGLALRLSLAENIGLGALGRIARIGWLSGARLRRLAIPAADALSTVYRDIGQRALDLSGGNQQKVALARLRFSQARVLLLDEPTRGIDVGSKVLIYEWLNREAAEGKAILLTSSHNPELLGICDRIGVMYRGRLVALAPRAQWTEERLLRAATLGEPPPREEG
ncbi:MAG TPA: sugar ABC transporter ATP-binding protein [Candidatus Sumerlaeota bacterium]|nr:sugar ABC transporter ATP-binding protein [Candidatus Sumerlaeota bacterium]HOR28500.1 sugar ABC transporter ATP-binding protein [Candidatus Sumerlaeota bacterium]HPK01427.1 sugar ABC transporter ATP-binding protein [Candidatus Sumerlaeota bacterium]